MSEEDLERYESEIELALVQEYRAVLPMFAYVVETERRFYLANKVEVVVRDGSSPACVEVTLSDAWVWDMYRPARFVPSVRILTFRDVNIERLPRRNCEPGRQSATGARRRGRGHGGGLVRGPRLRDPRAQLAPSGGRSRSHCASRANRGILRGQDPHR